MEGLLIQDVKEKTEEMIMLREFMLAEYGSYYMSAMYKLSVPNAYDSNRLIKHEFELTDKEKEALIYFIPNLSSYINNEHDINSNGRHI